MVARKSGVTLPFANDIRPDEHCLKCGCNLEAKTSCLSCTCPIFPNPLWDAVASGDDDNYIQKQIEDGSSN